MNQAASFGLLAVGGVAVVKALTGSSWADVVKGTPGTVASTGATLATAGVAGIPAAASSAVTAVSAANAPAKVQAALARAESLVGAPYSEANHAGAFAQTAAEVKKLGTDCSGLVSTTLGPLGAGILSAPQTTATLPTADGISTGAGKYISVYDRSTEGAQDHTIIDIAGNWFESGGNTTDNPSSNDGVTALSDAEARAELAGGGFTLYHPTGL